MSARKAAKKYGPGGQYYRRRITRPDGKTEDVYAKTQAELAEILYGHEIGDEIKVTVWRDGAEITRTIRLGTVGK
jgi:hypothetical protein